MGNTEISRTIVNDISELQSWASEFAAKYFKPQTLILLVGELGAGKTEFVKQLSQALKMSAVSSPTYAVLQRYEKSGGPSLYHVDLYRVKDASDLESTGFWDLFSESGNVVLVEWGNMISEEHYPINWNRLKLEIKAQSSGVRELILSCFL